MWTFRGSPVDGSTDRSGDLDSDGRYRGTQDRMVYRRIIQSIRMCYTGSEVRDQETIESHQGTGSFALGVKNDNGPERNLSDVQKTVLSFPVVDLDNKKSRYDLHFTVKRYRTDLEISTGDTEMDHFIGDRCYTPHPPRSTLSHVSGP